MLKHEDTEPPKIVKLLEVIDTEETFRLGGPQPPDGGGGPRRVLPAGLGSAALSPAWRGAPGHEAEQPPL